MLAQHWATSWCRRPSVEQTISAAGVSLPCPDYKTPISGQLAAIAFIFRPRRGNMWCKVLYIADLFCLHGNIRPGNITISLFFGASKLFFDFFVFFQLRSVGYIASYKLNFQNWQHWKCLIPRSPFKALSIKLPKVYSWGFFSWGTVGYTDSEKWQIIYPSLFSHKWLNNEFHHQTNMSTGDDTKLLGLKVKRSRTRMLYIVTAKCRGHLTIDRFKIMSL